MCPYALPKMQALKSQGKYSVYICKFGIRGVRNQVAAKEAEGEIVIKICLKHQNVVDIWMVLHVSNHTSMEECKS
jgi:hypothetical protein